MSERTLDDLAARLAEKDIKSRVIADSLLIFVPVCPGGFSDRIGVKEDGTISVNGGITHAVIDVLTFIRQWQASAEPAPPPAAPVVTITQAMIDAGANALAGSHMGSFFSDDEIAEIATEAAKACLDAALRGTDLAPEGARDAG